MSMFGRAANAKDLLADEAAADRLGRVTSRGRTEQALYPTVCEEKPKSAAIRRLFWTPDALLDAKNSR